jgi:ribosomal protein L34E
VNEYTVWIWEIKNFRMKKHAYGRCFGTVLCSKCCVEVQITIKFYIET